MFTIMEPKLLAQALANTTSGKDWGPRTHPITGELEKWHNGLDISVPVGTTLFAPWDGIVKQASKDNLNGNFIILTHDPATAEGVEETAYVHLSSFIVKTGDTVKAGQIIGFTGNTGASTGPHLHFVIRTAQGSNVSGEHHRDVDPMPYLTKKKIAGMGIVSGILLAAVAVFIFLKKT